MSAAEGESQAGGDGPLDITTREVTLRGGGQWANDPQTVVGVARKAEDGNRTGKNRVSVSA